MRPTAWPQMPLRPFTSPKQRCSSTWALPVGLEPGVEQCAGAAREQLAGVPLFGDAHRQPGARRSQQLWQLGQGAGAGRAIVAGADDDDVGVGVWGVGVENNGDR